MAINLFSDTVTKPSAEMLAYMIQVEVGDDVYRQDPTVNKLEEMVSSMFGMEEALFCPSGTMTNQLAIKCHTQPLDEVICDHYSHVYQYESGGYSFNSGVAIKLIAGTHGKITAPQITEAINPTYDWLPHSSLVVLENTCNKGGGSIYTLDEIIPITALCKEKDLALHLDGARLFNALVETEESTIDVGRCFDSISICLSKGLGAPVGSLLIGSKEFIAKARRFRKVLGGGMRQAGILAGAGIYALENNIERLKMDNDRAKEVADVLKTQSYVKSIQPVQTNILIFELQENINSADFIQKLESKGILAPAFGKNTIRLTFHMDISYNDVDKVKSILGEL